MMLALWKGSYVLLIIASVVADNVLPLKLHFQSCIVDIDLIFSLGLLFLEKKSLICNEDIDIESLYSPIPTTELN